MIYYCVSVLTKFGKRKNFQKLSENTILQFSAQLLEPLI